mgnify:CR=1 FL=1
MAAIFSVYQNSTLFSDIAANWMEVGGDPTAKQVIQERRGRIGLLLIIGGFVFLTYGSNAIIYTPTKSEAVEIKHRRKMNLKA